MRSLLAYLATYPSPSRPEFCASVAAVAERLGARVRAVTTDPVLNLIFQTGFGAVMQEVVDEAVASAHLKAKLLPPVMDAAAAAAGIQLEHREISGDAAEIGRTMGRWSLVHDLTVMEMRDHDAERGVAEAIVFNSRRPLLVLPVSLTMPFRPRRIVIAWNGGASAARAVGEALPWLAGATDIEIISVQESDPLPEGAGLEDAAEYLKAHGHIVRTTTLTSDHRPISAAIFDHAVDMRADMVVMGAYSHSRAREFVLGGVTHDALTEPQIPMLMVR